MPLEKLISPPIVEVVSGVIFEPIPSLGPVLAGAYWTRRREDYPVHELRPAVTADGTLLVGMVPPLRTMLFHKTGTQVLQLQGDRFYVNWRRAQGDSIEGARAGEYPRFTDRPGHKGLVSIVDDEYRAFDLFCGEMFGRPLVPQSVELAKIDLLIEGVDWNDFGDLVKLLPWLQSFSAFARSSRPAFALRFDEPREDALLAVTISQSNAVDATGTERRLVKLETRIVKTLGKGVAMRDAFLAANAELNAVFAEMIPKPERDQRFNVRGEA